MQRRVSADRVLAAAALAVPLVIVIWIYSWVGFTYIGAAMMAMLVGKLLLAKTFRNSDTANGPVPDLRVCLVVPLHNEDPALAVAAIRSLLAQTRQPDRIHVIDDGSSDGGAAITAVEAVLWVESRNVEWMTTRLEVNRGKRHALSVGFRTDPFADVYACIDSDTILDPEAVAEGIRPMSDPTVAATTGIVSAINWRHNLLTRLIDLRYVSAFLAERAAYSFFGAVLCCSGALSFYRASVVRANLDDFVAQEFLGETATFGDDRRLTNYALRAGRVVLAERAQAATAVPERLSHFIRQQVRWNKSFIRESTWVLGTFPITHNAFWLTLAEVIAWAFVGFLMMFTMIVLPMAGEFARLVPALLLIPIIAYARNAFYLENSDRNLTVRERLSTLALAPIYGLIHIVLLMPLRIYALATLKTTGWGTRKGGVEVRLGSVAGA